MRPTIILLVVLALATTACVGQDRGDGVASLDGTGAEDELDSAQGAVDDQVDAEQALLDFTQCLRDEGLDIEDPEMDADGNLNFRQLAQGIEGVDREALRVGFEACQSELEGITLGRLGGVDRTAIQDTLIEYAACMRDNGYDMEDPNLADFGPGSGDSQGQPGQGGGPFGSIDQDDPKFIEANEICEEIFTSAVPRFLGGEGGTGGDG